MEERGEVRATLRPRLSLAVITLVLFVTFLDNTIVAVALSSIQQSLHAGITQLQWVVNGYALAFAGLMLGFGTLGDRLGRRRVMVGGLVVFTAGSLFGLLATTPSLLITARVIMGVGAAASEPGTLSMIRQLYPDRGERAQALGVWSAISGLALAAGPVIGGLLVGAWSWRGVFAFNVAAGVIAIAGVQAVLPESLNRSRNRLDFSGIVFAALAVTAATFATIEGETSGYRTWWIILLYVGAIAAFGAFIGRERKASEPVLDLTFFRRPQFTAGMVIAFTGFFATFAVFFFVPLFVQLLGNDSSFQLVLDFLPMAAALVVVSGLSGRWIARVGAVPPMVVGGVAAGAGILITDGLLKPTSGPGLLGWSLAIVGAGLGILMVAATSSVLTAVPGRRSGMAASAVNTSRELGAVTGVAILGAIVDGQLTTNLMRRLAELHLPAPLRETVIVAVTTGNTSAATGLPKTAGTKHLIDEITAAAEASFSSGLDRVLILAGALMLASALMAAFIAPKRLKPSLDTADELPPSPARR